MSIWGLRVGAVGVVVAVSYCAPAQKAAPAFRSKELGKLIVEKRIESIEALLAELPPFTKESYVLVHESRSSQKGSKTAPRAIVFSQDSRFVFAFNGDPSLRGYPVVEIIEFADDREEFEFREVYENGPGKLVTLTEPDSSACITCHQAPARPNWDPYPEWKGAFGADQDMLLPDSEETADLKAFLADAKEHPRYGQLIGLDRYTETREEVRARTGAARADFEDHRMVRRSSARLTEELFLLNAKRIARDLLETPGYGAYRYALLGVLLDCQGIERLTPERFAKPLREFLGSMPRRLPIPKIAGPGILFGEGKRRKHFETHPRHNARVETMLFLAQNDLFRLANWSMQLLPGVATLDFRNTSDDLIELVLRELQRRDPSLAGLDSCQALAARAVR